MKRETRLAKGQLPPLDRASIHPYDDATPGPVYYQRDAHPVGVEAEALLGELEGGHALLLRPLEHGADLVLHSATKGLAGHHDVLLGAVACANAEDAETLRKARTQTGSVAAPDPAWLLLRGMNTLAVRLERQSAGALEL